MQTNTHAWGYGLATIAGDGTVLDTWYPAPQLGQLPEGRDKWIVPAQIEDLVGADSRRNVTLEAVTVEINLTEAANGCF